MQWIKVIQWTSLYIGHCLLPQLHSLYTTSEVGTPLYKRLLSRQLGSNGVCYREVPLYVYVKGLRLSRLMSMAQWHACRHNLTNIALCCGIYATLQSHDQWYGSPVLFMYLASLPVTTYSHMLLYLLFLPIIRGNVSNTGMKNWRIHTMQAETSPWQPLGIGRLPIMKSET